MNLKEYNSIPLHPTNSDIIKYRKLNKYHLTVSDIRKLKVAKLEALQKAPFWRNNVVHAYCLSGEVGDDRYCDGTDYWIGFYDKDAPYYAGKVRINFDTFGGVCSYNFKRFFGSTKSIDCRDDLAIQIECIRTVNMLIDKGVLELCDNQSKIN